MNLTLNVDLVQWLDANRDDKSRQAYIVALLKDAMNNTNFHTKGTNDEVSPTALI